ncbi:MAG: ATP synthase F1 subunit gamma [Ruminococcaceae bacterium]|nr:ATP synthase F1 subunit gamma [Oscillospiraceae bacterium]
MATVSTKEIRSRIRSMESTKQITKAMEMVASSKLRQAQSRALAARPYFEALLATIRNIAAVSTETELPYLTVRPVKRSAVIVIAGDRGLAGGYNSNILKLAQTQCDGRDVLIVPIGKKAVDYFKARQPVYTEQYAEAGEMTVGDCFSVAKQLAKEFCDGRIDEILLCYTKFVSVLSQMPDVQQLLPLKQESAAPGGQEILYEPDAQTVLEKIVPEYLGGALYGALCESRAAEHAARRTAMNAATQNAEDMIEDLSLKFNQARQAAITQEITEIVAGS